MGFSSLLWKKRQRRSFIHLIKEEELRRQMGKRTKQTVKEWFLMTRLLERYLDLSTPLKQFTLQKIVSRGSRVDAVTQRGTNLAENHRQFAEVLSTMSKDLAHSLRFHTTLKKMRAKLVVGCFALHSRLGKSLYGLELNPCRSL
jgi:hypothetical protein